jgi:hypothetical protein
MATKSQILRKDQVLAALVETRQNILVEMSGLSDERQDQIFLGVWSVRDLLAHLIGWDHTNLEAVKSVLAGRVPAFYEHHDRDWQTYNAMLVRKHKKGTFRELTAEARASQEHLLEFLDTVPPENFNKDFGVRFRGYKVTVQRLLEAERGDEQTHLQQIMNCFKDAK